MGRWRASKEGERKAVFSEKIPFTLPFLRDTLSSAFPLFKGEIQRGFPLKKEGKIL